jgi:hypothetical protein
MTHPAPRAAPHPTITGVVHQSDPHHQIETFLHHFLNTIASARRSVARITSATTTTAVRADSTASVARLPRAGMWTVWVKRVFAAVMFGVAEYYFIQMGKLLI